MPQNKEGLMSEKRRSFIKRTAAAAASLTAAQAVQSVAYAAGSDAPEKKEVRIGFIPLTDCASVVMASVLKFDEKYGIKIIPSKEASWASVRDKLVNGELDAAHVLYGLIYGVHLGVGGPKKDMAVLMTLNNNGQAITLSKKLAEKGAVDGPSLAKAMKAEKRDYTFAQTFPTGTHAMWLYYWLAANGINPMSDAKIITVPPPQMVANMRVGNMDGYLRRRAVEASRHRRQRRLHRRHDAGHLEGPPGEGARHDRGVRAEASEHDAGDDGRRARCLDGGSTPARQPAEDGRDHRRQVRTSTAPVDVIDERIARATTTTASAGAGTTRTT